MPASRITLTLRRIVWPADFRRSEVTLMSQLPQAWVRSLRGNDCVCFVSGVGSQVMFVYRPIVVGEVTATARYEARERVAYVSAKVRLNVGAFNPEMLANYASEAQVTLHGIKRFEDRYRALRQED